MSSATISRFSGPADVLPDVTLECDFRGSGRDRTAEQLSPPSALPLGASLVQVRRRVATLCLANHVCLLKALNELGLTATSDLLAYVGMQEHVHQTSVTIVFFHPAVHEAEPKHNLLIADLKQPRGELSGAQLARLVFSLLWLEFEDEPLCLAG